jgi:predicted acyl esterase
MLPLILPPEMTRTLVILRSGGKANTLSGDGTLSTTPPAAEAADKYVYDPADPIVREPDDHRARSARHFRLMDQPV